MSEETIAHLRDAVDDPTVLAHYEAFIRRGSETDCDLWTGAISGKGHGRFFISSAYTTTPAGNTRRRTFVIIAHRFGYAAANGVDALLEVPILAHRCDNPLCQKPSHWRESNHTSNRREFLARQHEVRGPLADLRGSNGRARAVRDAAKAGLSVSDAVAQGQRPVHRDQLDLFRLF